MKANPNFDYLHEKLPNQRITLLQGGTRSGKTYATIYFLIDYCLMYSGMEIDICRDTFTALKATAWKDFKDVLISCNLYNDKNHNKTDHSYLLNGNTINYYGADTPDKIHGRSRDILWINEAHQFPQETIDQLFPRTRYKIIADYNPALGLEHWLDPYIEKYPPLITTYKDNPFLPNVIIESIEELKNTNKSLWTIYGLGEQAVIEGVVFKKWQIVEEIPSYIRNHKLGLDFGYSNDPTTIIDVAVQGNNVYLDELCYETEMTTIDIVRKLKQLPRYKAIADNAEPRLIAEIHKAGINIHPAKKGAGSIEAGILVMQSMNIFITKRSYNLIKEFKNYTYSQDKDGRWLTVPIDNWNHGIDPTRYVLLDEYGVIANKGIKKMIYK